MKIAIVRHSIRNRGSDRVLSDYIFYLKKQGHEIVYYTNEVQSRYPLPSDLEIKKIPIPGVLGTLLFILFKRIDADIVLVDLVVMAVFGWLRNRRSLVYMAQDYDVEYYSSFVLRKFTDFCYVMALKFFQVPVLTVSDGLADMMNKYGATRCISIPNGVDFKEFFPNANSEYHAYKKGKIIILYFVRNDFRKGLDIALKTFNELAKMSNPDAWEVWTIGEPMPSLENVAVHHWGFVDLQKLRNLLSASDIYLSSSRSEGLSTLLLQAMACGCAIVATPATTILTHEVHGLIGPHEDHLQLAKYLKTLIENTTLREDLKAQAFDLSKDYQIEVCLAKAEKALLHLAASRHS